MHISGDKKIGRPNKFWQTALQLRKLFAPRSAAKNKSKPRKTQLRVDIGLAVIVVSPRNFFDQNFMFLVFARWFLFGASSDNHLWRPHKPAFVTARLQPCPVRARSIEGRVWQPYVRTSRTHRQWPRLPSRWDRNETPDASSLNLETEQRSIRQVATRPRLRNLRGTESRVRCLLHPWVWALQWQPACRFELHETQLSESIRSETVCGSAVRAR